MKYNETYNKNTVEDQIIEMVTKAKQKNDEGAVFAADRTQYITRTIIDYNVRSYEGIYINSFLDNGEKKLWWPMTSAAVNHLAAQIDFDVKDVKVTPKTDAGKGTALLLRSKLYAELEKKQFGTLFNEAALEMLKQGSLLIRTYEEDGVACSDIVDLHNIWTEWYTNKPKWYLERIYKKQYDLPESFAYPDKAVEANYMDKYGFEVADEVDCWRYEGKIPMSFITENPKDTKRVLGVIWITNLLTNPVIQDIYTIKECSYSYGQLEPRSYRWLGRGIAEGLLPIQEYMNEIINLRRQRGRLATLGSFLIKKGSGITPDMISNLTTGSGLPVNDVNSDIRRLETTDVPSGNFLEETRIQQMADRLTGSNEVNRGEGTSIQTATEAEILKLASETKTNLYREQLAFVFEDVIKKWLKILGENMKQEEIIKLTANQEERKQIAMSLAWKHVANQMKETIKIKGVAYLYPLATEIGKRALQDMVESVANSQYMSKEHWTLFKESVKDLDYELTVNVGNESDLAAVKSENMKSLLELVAKGFLPELDASEIALDMMEAYGLNSFKYKKSESVVPGPTLAQQPTQ
jgi:hypothetical protein